MGINLGSTAIADAKLGSTQVNKIYLGSTEVWSKAPAPAIKALKFTSSGSQTLGIDNTKLGTISPNFEYSTDDGSTWTTWDVTTTLAFGNGTDLYVRGSNTFLAITGTNYTQFTFSTSSPVACSGNIMHLFDYTQDLTAFPDDGNGSSRGVKNMFSGCTVLTSAPELPATTLTDYCYNNMFYQCSSLTTVPNTLPAIVMKPRCYYSMFSNCSALTTPPSLPATTLADSCYMWMFSDSGITSLPFLPATSAVSNCYNSMFYQCAGIKISTTQTGEYITAYTFGFNPNSQNAGNMFYGTGGTFTGTPTQRTYYTPNTIVS